MKNEAAQFGKKLKEVRLKKKLLQGMMAKTLGINRSYISGQNGACGTHLC